MIDEYRIEVRLCLSGSIKFPPLSELDKKFGVTGAGFRQGETFSSKTQPDKVYKRARSVWYWSKQDKIISDDISKHIECLLNVFEPKIDELRDFLTNTSITAYIYIWVESVDCETIITISAEHLRRLSALCNVLNITGFSSDNRYVGACSYPMKRAPSDERREERNIQ